MGSGVEGRAAEFAVAKGVGAAGFVHAMMRSGDVIDIGCQSMLIGMGWGISAVFADPTGVKDPVYLPTGQLTAFYSKHHGDRLVRVEMAGVPTYEQPYRMAGSARKKVAALDVVATPARPLSLSMRLSQLTRRWSRDRSVGIPGRRRGGSPSGAGQAQR